MKRAFIFGQGGHANVIKSFLVGSYSEIFFIGPDQEKEIFTSPAGYLSDDFFMGIGDNARREMIFLKAMALGFKLPVCIGPNSSIAPDVAIGAGSFIGAGAVVISTSRIGENVIINTLSSVDHDCHIGSHSQLTAGVILGGGTTIGERCFFGVRSSTIPGIAVGDKVQVMAGSVLTKDVESNVVTGGYPARVFKAVE